MLSLWAEVRASQTVAGTDVALFRSASTENSKFLIRSRLKEIAFSGLEAVAFSENSIHVSVHDLYRFQATQRFQ